MRRLVVALAAGAFAISACTAEAPPPIPVESNPWMTSPDTMDARGQGEVILTSGPGDRVDSVTVKIGNADLIPRHDGVRYRVLFRAPEVKSATRIPVSAIVRYSNGTSKQVAQAPIVVIPRHAPVIKGVSFTPPIVRLNQTVTLAVHVTSVSLAGIKGVRAIFNGEKIGLALSSENEHDGSYTASLSIPKVAPQDRDLEIIVTDTTGDEVRRTIRLSFSPQLQAVTMRNFKVEAVGDRVRVTGALYTLGRRGHPGGWLNNQLVGIRFRKEEDAPATMKVVRTSERGEFEAVLPASAGGFWSARFEGASRFGPFQTKDTAVGVG